MFNLSLQTSQVIDDWCNTVVTPVAKSPRIADPNLFRPISLTSVVCKFLEAIIKQKMLAHLPKFSLLTSRQYSFLLRCLALTNLHVAEELITKLLNEGSAVDLIYPDLSNTFDSVNHRLLLTKLRGYGIAPIVIS